MEVLSESDMQGKLPRASNTFPVGFPLLPTGAVFLSQGVK